MGGFHFIEHTADVAVEIQSDSLKDLFTIAGTAWRQIVFGPSEIRPSSVRNFETEAESCEELLVEFLSELNYIWTIKRWIAGKVEEVIFREKPGIIRLNAQLSGEAYEPDRHIVEVEIKAVTFHQMDIKFEEGQYTTKVVFDI
jgi:SHS2 domain-containing protein